MITPNLYGNIVANVVAGLTGGPGIMPGANVGNHVAVFEQGARHVGQDVRPIAFSLLQSPNLGKVCAEKDSKSLLCYHLIGCTKYQAVLHKLSATESAQLWMHERLPIKEPA